MVPMSNFLETFSDRSKMVLFLTRNDAGRRGANGLEPGDLLEAIINEDQGELPKRFVGGLRSPVQHVLLSRFSQQNLLQRFFCGFTTFCPIMNPLPIQWTCRCPPAFSKLWKQRLHSLGSCSTIRCNHSILWPQS